MSATITFTITYSKNGDGGKQEYKAALEALQRVFPDAGVVENRVDKYPIRVIVSAQTDDAKSDEIWSGRQQDLFSKYAAKRSKAMSTIEASLKELKKTL